MRLFAVFVAVLATLLPTAVAVQANNGDDLATAKSPADYVLAKAKEHRIVLLGEAHWIQHDPELVRDLAPRLSEAGVTALAMEILPASEQGRLDTLVNAPAWDELSAMVALRKAEFPYREYLDILHAVWQANRNGGKLRLLALGPGMDWRETLLPKGQTYDGFMADVVTRYLGDANARVVIYAGLNHCFTRYHQPEMPRATKVEAFMDRAGNMLWRRFGEDVFLIVLHHPWRCFAGGKMSRCLPAGGAIDCAAAEAKHPVGFDLRNSAFADARLSGFEYALGYPDLRLIDMADGYIWQKPIEQYRSATLIPLAEFAPDAAALAYVAAHPPFSDTKGASREQLEQQWKDQGEWLRDAQKTRGWGAVAPKCGR